MKFNVIIPARYGSTRFPGKPLVTIQGKPMVEHVYERALQASADAVYVATDDQRIYDAVLGFGGKVIMTRDDHESGTERLAEVVTKLELDDDTVVVNVQGDEPFIPAAIIRQVAHNLHANADADMATLGCRIDDIHEFYNPNAVKVVRDHAGMAMYFSRSPMPYVRDAMLDGQQTVSADNCQLDLARFEFLRHIGIYGYRAGYLRHYTSLPMTTLEQLESLEQLRVLYHGGNIHVDIALENPPPGIDTPEDLADLEL